MFKYSKLGLDKFLLTLLYKNKYLTKKYNVVILKLDTLIKFLFKKLNHIMIKKYQNLHIKAI